MNASEERYQKDRERMVERQLVARGIRDQSVLFAFLKVPRHLFVSKDLENQAYEDHPIQIGYEQTISQPYIVAFMLERLELKKEDKVLEIGTGTGYQTALLAELVEEVYSIEIIQKLFESAKHRLNRLGYPNIHLACNDGRNGWEEKRPFNKIIVSAATAEVPKKLIEQLNENGLMIVPVGSQDQDLVLSQKRNGVLHTKQLIPVRFVPLTGNN